MQTAAAQCWMDDQALQHQPISIGAPQALPDKLITRLRLEQVVDKTIAAQLNEGPIAGAVVSIVRGGETLLLKAYGHADASRRTPMDAQHSLVRIGSVSKMFTWTAIMQLCEAGLLDLKADVNAYLERPYVPNRFGRPVTLQNLMTHTAGLEDNNMSHMIDRTASDLEPLARVLQQHVPEQVLPPTTDFTDGRFASYSNWGGALAGHIISRVSDMPFEQFVEARLFGTLGMGRTTFREPLPADWLPWMASGHELAREKLRPQPFEFHGSFAPAGSATTTAGDMARFMSAHLQLGRFQGQSILQEDTARQMQARTLSPNTKVNGVALGFYEDFPNGRRSIGHGGDTLFFSAQMNLLPEQNLGVFVAYNTRPPMHLRNALMNAIMDEFFPAKTPTIKPQPISSPGRYQGFYRSNRHSYSTFEKVHLLVDIASTVRVQEKGEKLRLTNLGGKGVKDWFEVDPGVFREESGQNVVAFAGNDAGKATHLLRALPFDPLHRISWFQTPQFHLGLLLVFVFVSTCFLSYSMGFLPAHAGESVSHSVRLAAQILAVLNLSTVLVLIGIFVLGIAHPLYEITWPLRLAVNAPLLALPLAVLVLAMLPMVWLGQLWDTVWRTHYSLHALMAPVFLWQLHHWNLLGERFP